MPEICKLSLKKGLWRQTPDLRQRGGLHVCIFINYDKKEIHYNMKYCVTYNNILLNYY